jgi:hypothetical protein
MEREWMNHDDRNHWQPVRLIRVLHVLKEKV